MLAVAILMPVIACVNYKKVKLTSVSISSLTPAGLKSVNGTLKLGVENNSSEFTVMDVEGSIYRSGEAIGTFTIEPVTIKSGSSTYSVPGTVSLNSNVSIIEIISIASNFKMDDFSMDLTLKVKPKGGTAQKITRRDIPINDFINTLKTRGV